jgi:hypothetical protein
MCTGNIPGEDVCLSSNMLKYRRSIWVTDVYGVTPWEYLPSANFEKWVLIFGPRVFAGIE